MDDDARQAPRSGPSRRQFVAGSAAALALRASSALADAGGGMTDPLALVAPELRDAARIVLDQARAFGPLDATSLPRLRTLAAGKMVEPEPDVPIAEHRIAVRAIGGEVVVYVVNARPGLARPGILHTHGGGFVVDSARAERRFLQGIARDLDCTIVSVEYSLAPEARYTRSIEENHAGLVWLYDNAAALGIDRARIAVMGESAGGGHAALLAIAARDRGTVPLVFQALVYPMLDDRTGSGRDPAPGLGRIGWDGPSNRFGWAAFLGTAPGSADVPRAAVPARTVSLAGLAPAFIAVGGLDLFLHEDVDYALRLTDAGVPVQLLVTPGAFHGFDRAAPDATLSRQFIAAKLDALRRAFATGVGPAS